jgi:YD repeat-containing protein
VRTIQYAKDATNVTDTSFAVTTTATLDRTTLMAYDSHNHVTHARDAAGGDRYASYTARGEVAKEWQPVKNNDNVIETLATFYEYDALGRRTIVREPQSSTVTVKRESVYNAFGEVIATKINDLAHEYFDYDKAGRVWRTNSGDGVDRIYLYNLAGQATVEISSQTTDLSSSNIELANLAADLLEVDQMRTETVYDKLGRVVTKREVEYDAASLVDQSSTTFHLGNPFGANQVFLHFDNDRPGDTIKLQYRTAGSNDAFIDGPAVIQLSGAIWGADVSAFRGTKEFRVTFTAPGASTHHLIHTGTFTVGADSNSNLLELHPKTTALANNLTITAAGLLVTATWSAKPSVTQARFEMSLDGVTWYTANATLSGGTWSATLGNIQDDANGTSQDWKYRVVENVDGTPVTMSIGTLEKDGASLVTNTTINSTGQPFDSIDPASISVGSPTQLADVQVHWNPYGGNLSSCDFAWRPLQPANAPWQITTRITDSFSLPNLPPGQYQVQITRWEWIYEFENTYESVTATTDGTFTVNSNGSVTLNIPPSENSLSVTVASSPHAATANVTITWPGPISYNGYDIVGWKLVGTPGSGSQFPNRASVGGSGTLSGSFQYGQTYEIQVERWQTIYNLPPEEVFQSAYTFTFTVGGTNPSPVYTSTTIPYIGPVTVDTADHSVIRVPRPSKPGSRIDVTFTGVNGTSGSFTRNFAAPAGDGSWTLDLDNPPAGEAVLPPGHYAFSVRYFDANNAFYANNGGFLDLTQSMSGPGKIQIRSVTSPEQIDTLRQIDDPVVGGGRTLLYWDTPSGTTGDQIKFQVLWDDPNDGITGRVWRTLPLITVGSGRAVDLSALPVSDFSYELTYTRPSEGSPHRIASGIVSVYEPTVTGTNLTDTTSSSADLDPANVMPVFEQTLDRWGNVLSYTVAAQTEAEQTTHYTYNQRNQVTQITLPTTSVRSTLNGIVSAPVDDQAIIARNYYDLKGNLIATVDPNGNRNRVSYNLASQVLSQQQAESTSITGTASAAKHYVYNAFGEQIQITDELGYLTRMSYDAGGRLRRVAREVTAGAFFAADDAADGATNGTVANPRGVLETFNYAFDPAHIVTVAYDYDEAGRRIRETTGELMTGGGAETIKYWYDLRGNLIRSRLPVGQAYETTYSYDAYGNGKKILEIDAIGGTQNWAYDSFGKLLNYTDIHGEFGGQATGSTVTYQYNGAGLLTRQTSTYGQDITYGYDHAGHLTSIVENSNAIVGVPTEGLANVHRRSYYSYDAAGRRTREQVFVDDHEYQDTIASYDAQGRISHLQDDRYNTTYEYDKAGNRTHIYTQYTETDQLNGSWQRVDDLWYTYDGANRVTISQGRLANGMVTDQSPSVIFPGARDQAVRNTYNAAGQRIESEQFGPNSVVNETTGAATAAELGRYVSRYEYDGLGRLTEQSRMTGGEYQGQPYNELWDRRTYDGASRLKTQNIRTIENSRITTRDSVMVYDDNGRLASQASQVLDRSTGTYEPVNSTLTYGQATYSNGNWTRGFDAAGNLRSYAVATTDPDTDEVETVQHLYSYRSGSSYAEVTHSQIDGDNHVIPAVSHRGYNLNGELGAFVDHFGPEKNRYFVNNADGQAIKVLQGDFTALTPQQLLETFQGVDHADLPQHQLIFDGKLIGSLQSDGDRFLANFDVNYTPVSEQYPSATPAQVVVQTGDTLRILAARIWGDGNLWYVIADANGLQDGPDGLLTAGQLLQIPNEVVSLANTSNTFKPFNLNQVLGDTTPTQAPPPPPQNGGGCGLVGQVLVAVVAIVVTAYLGPVIGNAVGTALGGAAATGAAYSTGYAIGYGVGAAAGNAVGQGVGIAIGQQEGFSWKQVGAAALTAGILKGTPVGELGVSSNELLQTAFQGAVNSTVTQGVNVAMGLQESFDWREVALSAVSSVAAAQVGQWTAGQLAGTRISAPLATAVTSAASGVASALVRRSLGGRMSTDAILADVFASAIGNAIVSGMTPRPTDTTPQPIGITPEQWADVDRQLSAANQGAFDDQLQRDIRQQQFQVSLQRDLERSLSNNPEFVANLPAPTVEFEDDIFGGANPFAGARLTPTFGDAVMEYDSRVLHAIDVAGGLAPGEEWNSLLTAARQSGRSMDQVAADRKRAAALAAAASPSARERAGFYDVEKELQRSLVALPEPPKYPFDTRGVAMSAWDPAQARREQLGWSAIGAVESNVFSAAGYIVGNLVTDPDQAAVVALRSGVAGDALLALGSARLAKVDFRSMSLPAEQAMAWQGQGLYPGVDRYRNVTLQPGIYVVGASPGQGNYYTTMSGLVRTGGDVIKYYQGVQVAPNLTNPARDVVRDGLMIYRVEELTPAAFGITSANPQYGQGRLPQIFISDYSRLTPVQLVPFQNKTPGVRPVEIMR